MRLLGTERVNQEGGEGKDRLRSRGTWLGGLLVVGLILATAGAVTAQSTGVITGCVQKQTGALRISTSGSCDSRTETVLTWNAQGPQGPQGEQGPQGPQGEQGPDGGDAGTLDGRDSADFAAAYERTVVVSPTGTDIENGTALKNALAGITDASATKPYLLYIEPGTYDLGTFGGGNLPTIRMKPHVDIQGAGELQTLIISSKSSCGAGSTLYGANDTEVRFLTVRATGTETEPCSAAIYNDHVSSRLTHVTAEAIGAGGGNHWGVFNESPTAVKMTDVTATASGGRGLNIAVDCLRGANISMTDVTATASGGTDNHGVSVGGSATVTDVTATASGGTFSTGLSALGSGATITDVTATASGGTASGTDFSSGMSLVFATDVTVRQSKISGTGAALKQSSGISSNNSVALSQIVGPIQSPVPLKCFNNYDENLAAITCPQ